MSNTRREKPSEDIVPRGPSRPGPPRHLDSADLLFEVGRQVQELALQAKRHRIVPAQQICECGRLALRLLPVLGLRCEIVCDQWDLAYRLLSRVLERMAGRSLGGEVASRATGRAAVPARGVGASPRMAVAKDRAGAPT